MSLKKIVGALLVVASLAGCASGPKFTDLQKSNGIPSMAADAGRIFFYRENSMMGAAIQPNIQLDGRVVGESIPGGFFFVDAAPGPHTALVGTEVDRSASFVLAAGETKYIRTSISMGLMAGHVTPELVDPADAQKVLNDLSYTAKPTK